MTDDATKMKQERDLALAECERLRAALKEISIMCMTDHPRHGAATRFDIDRVARAAIDAVRGKP